MFVELPDEVVTVNHLAIRTATLSGRVVVELAGNGSEQLNRGPACFQDPSAVCFGLDRSRLVASPHRSTQSLATDLDGDGLTDIVVATAGSPVLYLQQARGRYDTSDRTWLAVDTQGEFRLLARGTSDRVEATCTSACTPRRSSQWRSTRVCGVLWCGAL